LAKNLFLSMPSQYTVIHLLKQVIVTMSITSYSFITRPQLDGEQQPVLGEINLFIYNSTGTGADLSVYA